MEITQLANWNPTSQKVLASAAIVSLLALITGIALMVLKSYGNAPLILYGSGGALLGTSLIYSLILCVKSSPSSSVPQTNRSSSESIALNHLQKDERETIIFTLLTETPEERKASIKQLSELSEKTEEDKVRESFYKKFPDYTALIEYLIDLPNFKEYLDSLNSDMIYDRLIDYAKKLPNTNKIVQVFLLLDDAHRCTLLREFFTNKKLFLTLIEKAPSSTKELLRKNTWLELLNLANELLNARFFKEVFYDVYASLCDEHQKICMKRFIQEPHFHSRRIEMTTKTQAALQHPIEFIEYTLEKGKTWQNEYSGKVRPSLPNDTTKFFDAIIPTLPSLHIVTFYWRIAKENLKVWDGRNGWTPDFQGKAEEKQFFMSLSFEQVARLNETEQPWIAMWHPSEQSDEKIIDACFNQLKRAKNTVTQYIDVEYDPQGQLFKKNWERFLFLLSFEQLSMLICQDPQVSDLNQIFGFKQSYQTISEEFLKDIPHSQHTGSISIPAILERWWHLSGQKLSEKEISPEERLEAIKALNLEDKYTLFFIHWHTKYEKIRPSVEASVKEITKLVEKARADVKEFINSKKTYAQFISDKHKERIRAEEAEQERKRIEEEQKRQNVIHRETIKKSLNVLGLDKTKEYSKREIESFVRKELFKHHMDKLGKISPIQIEFHNQQFIVINNASDELLKALEAMSLEKTPAF